MAKHTIARKPSKSMKRLMASNFLIQHDFLPITQLARMDDASVAKAAKRFREKHKDWLR